MRQFQEGVTSELLMKLVQKLEDVIKSYMDTLNLRHAEVDDNMDAVAVDGISATVHALHRKLVALKEDHFNISESRERVLVVGPEGKGKSTTINAILRSQMKEDACFAAACPSLKVSDRVVWRFPHDEVDMGPIHAAENVMKHHLRDQKSRVNQLKHLRDILTTGGCMGAVTGVTNQVWLNPNANCMSLKLVYHDKAYIDQVVKPDVVAHIDAASILLVSQMCMPTPVPTTTHLYLGFTRRGSTEKRNARGQ